MAMGKVTVLAYHRISTPTSPESAYLSPTLIDAYPDDFDANMRWLTKRYNVISGWQLVDALQEKKPLPPRAMMITFDDGYSCFLSTAVPILRKYKLPATLFVPTDYTSNPTRPFWWDTVYNALRITKRTRITIPSVATLSLNNQQEREAAYEALVGVIERTDADKVDQLVETIAETCDYKPSNEKQRLDWQEVKALSEAGDITIGSHTRSHPILSRTTAQQMQEEIKGSWDDLSANLSRPLPLFAYPNGQAYAINEANQQTVKQAGLPGAFTMMAGHNTPGQTNPYMMHRIGATAGLSLLRFKLRVSPLGQLLRQAKGFVRR
ncbi:MAG: polysaccharide deacetylase family protein [Chloroflexia bacterium]